MMLQNERIRIQSLNISVLNSLRLARIRITNICRDGGYIYFEYRHQDKKKLIEYLSSHGIEYKIIKLSIIPYIYDMLRRRIGIVVGCILNIILVVFLMNITLDISISGNELTPTSSINKVLRDNNVRQYSLKIRDVKELKDKLENSLPYVSYVNCYYTGGRLNIEIREELKKPSIDTNSSKGIIANYDGIVTRIICVSGTALVKEGDSVKKGELLIAPYKIYGEGEGMKRVDVVPSGEVYANIFLEENIAIHDKNIILKSTGKVARRISVFGKKKIKPPYKNYSTKIVRHNVFGILPIWYDEYIFEEKVEITVSATDESFRKSLINKAYNILNLRLIEGERVAKSWIFEKRLDNLHIISVYYEVERLISGG